jgi:Icc-related predicted phosphoesterase
MRLVIISDTHGRHEELGVLQGDVLIHCGDFCHGFHEDPRAVESLDAWFAKQRFELILCVGGNHDFAVRTRINSGQQVFHNAVWLQDADFVHEGVKFYGAPWIPHIQGWAFYLTPEGLRHKWSMIPDDTTVLITHTPPFGILDQPSSRQMHCGCPYLLERVESIRPRLHVFGHNHSSAGVQDREFTTFINASVVDSSYNVTRSAVVLDIPSEPMSQG